MKPTDSTFLWLTKILCIYLPTIVASTSQCLIVQSSLSLAPFTLRPGFLHPGRRV